MMIETVFRSRFVRPVLALGMILPATLSAGQFGDLTYEVIGATVEITGYTGAGGAVVIPPAIGGRVVASIGAGAFDDNEAITGVTIPIGVTSIGEAAFRGCTGLLAATLGNRVASIENSAFDGCIRLTGIALPDSATSIGEFAFSGCYTLPGIVIPDSVDSIGDYAFEGCYGLVSATIGSSVMSLGRGVFEGCGGLTSIAIPDDVVSIGYNAFAQCYRLASVTIGNRVATIGGSAFWGCSSLTDVTLPDSVTSIDRWAFGRCTSLTAISVGDLNSSFSSLEGVLFNKDRTELITCPAGKTGSYTIPGSVTSIGGSAFEDCGRLTTVAMPDGVESIGYSAFDGCSSLTAITVDAANAAYSSVDGVLFDKNQATLIIFPAAKAGSYIIPESVGSIEDYAFRSSASLTDVTIRSGVTIVGDSAFAFCANLTWVYFVGDAPTAGTNVFVGSDQVTVYHQSGSNGWGATFAGRPVELYPFLYTIGVDSTVAITGHAGTGTVLVIPSRIEGLPVTSIGTGAFQSWFGLTGITIPDGVASIGDSAFSSCTGLIAVTIPDSVTLLGEGVFSHCSSLTSATLGSGVTSIPDQVFFGCRSLGRVVIPEGISSIGATAFAECAGDGKGLAEVIVPGSVTSIGDGAFQQCTSLEQIAFAGDAPGVGAEIFDGCYNATVYYLAGSTGFTSPTWQGRPAYEIDEGTYPAGRWLLGHGYPYDTDLHQDLNGDGVDLLMAYALDLEPRNARAGMPRAVLEPASLGMKFYAGTAGITYTVQTSNDMVAWTTSGVVLSGPDPEEHVTATVGRSSPRRFMRLVVAEE